MLKGIRVILNEGRRSFLKKVKHWLRLRKLSPHKKNLSPPKFEAKVSLDEVKKLTFPIPSQKPKLSIIIPVYSKCRYTVNCLKSICENTDGDYEIIVVDDASSDETANVLSEIHNIRLTRNEQNAGFIESCNRGAEDSRGKYILFLHNDTMVTENWLPPLLEVIEKEEVGAVGSKLIYPDGILQVAGSIVWNDGSALGYGRGDDSSKPEYNYVREVDYCSGACLLVKRELFKNIGGFDERFKPGYFEDIDLCFSLRNLGYKVIYQPKSVIVHFEGITCGTDAFSGVKRYKEMNKPKFVEKWNTVLQRYHHYPNLENSLLARNRLPGKSVLVIDDRIPTPSQGAGYPRAYGMLKFIGEFGYKVTFYPLEDTTPWQPYTDEFQQSGIEVFYGNYMNFTYFAKDRAGYYDLILLSRPSNMEKAFSTIRRYFPNAFLLYDAEALLSVREILKAKAKGTKYKEEDAERMMNQEIDLINKADFIITVSENEKTIVMEKTQSNNVTVWGHSIEVKEPQTPFPERKDILFVGGFPALDSPNENAILYFSKEVFPEVKEELSCQLFITGINPPDSVIKLSSSSITVAGYVEDLREYYEKCRIFIVPHRYSAGIPLKLLEAMSYGIPSVISELTASQLDLTDGNEVLVARNTEEFKKKVVKLYQDEELWYKIQQNALNYIRKNCNPETLKAKLSEIIENGFKRQNKSRNIILKNHHPQSEIVRNLRGDEQLYRAIQNNDTQISELNRALQNKDAEIRALEAQIEQMQRGVAMQLLSRYRKVVGKLLPWGTRRRYYYELMLKGIRVILNEGWRSFWFRAKVKLKQRFPWHITDQYRVWIINNEPKAEALERQKEEALSFKYRPKISIVTPVWNTNEKWLRIAIESVIHQTYDDWELCLADGGSTKPQVRKVLEEYAKKDSRIKVKFLSQNKGIAGNSNEALSLASGDFIGLLDHYDELAPFALYECVKLLNERPQADFIYSDEDKITTNGKRVDPFFKPDWSPDMFLSFMYTCHLGIYRKKIVDEIAGFRLGYDGSQDYDLVLRFTEKTNRIYHIPQVLYHWRSHPGSIAVALGSKQHAVGAGREAISDYLVRNNIAGEVVDGLWFGSYRIKRQIVGNPMVSIIIPSKDNVSVLRTCVGSIMSKTDYENYEILIVDNQSTDSKTLDYYNEIGSNPKVRILHYERPFNFSALNNYAASQAKGEYLLLLNNDTQVISTEWLSAMLEHSQRKEVGAVGAKLLFPDGYIQHCGVILGLGFLGIAGHAFSRYPDQHGYFGRIDIISNYSAVTAACMMMRKQVFEEIGGLDEELTRSYNDIDLCLKIREKGYVIVYTPYANLYHLESYTRGYDDTHEKRLILRKETEYMRAKWGTIIDKGDPYYSPNLSLERTDFSVNR